MGFGPRLTQGSAVARFLTFSERATGYRHGFRTACRGSTSMARARQAWS